MFTVQYVIDYNMHVTLATATIVVVFILQVSVAVRVLLKPHREASSRIAWLLVVLTFPVAGIIAYLLFGETNIGSKRLARYHAATRHARKSVSGQLSTGQFEAVRTRHKHLFKLGQTVNNFGPLTGNRGELLEDTNAAIARLVQDIDEARDTVHLLFYIWLADNNGLEVVEAVKRAARRGVTVRVMADDIGSRHFIRSEHWQDMAAAGVKLAAALPVSYIFLHPLRGRVDLRNHRKIAVIDNGIAFCGSSNCADPEFRVKARFAPWVDLMLRFEGPVAIQLQYLFAEDWMAHTDEDLLDLIRGALVPAHDGHIVAQALGTGPTIRPSAMPEIFEALIHASREDLLITTPYYVPSDAMHDALRTAARRGVRTSLIVPQKNDSWIVAAASRSYYHDLIDAGVRIYEYPNGLLHAKTLTLDGEVALLGSANLDRRSFELNYESNILLQDDTLVARIAEQQAHYRAVSRRISHNEVSGWSKRRRLWNNAVAMIGPIL